jgi:hypothetical protein
LCLDNDSFGLISVFGGNLTVRRDATDLAPY